MQVIWNVLRLCFYAINLLVGCGFLYLLGVKFQIEYLSDSSNSLFPKICENSYDILQVAQQLGRLDYVSLGLTIVGIVLALFGFTGYWVVRHEVLKESQKATKEHAPLEIQKYFNEEQGKNSISVLLEPVLKEVLNQQEVTNSLGLVVAKEAEQPLIEVLLRNEAFINRLIPVLAQRIEDINMTQRNLRDRTIDSDITDDLMNEFIRNLDDDIDIEESQDEE